MLFSIMSLILFRCFLGPTYKKQGCDIMNRYNRILEKNPREIVLLKSRPCAWGRCFFCDYIEDNSEDLEDIIRSNKDILGKVKGDLKQLEVINSGSVFELPKKCLKDIKDIVIEKKIGVLYFESHYSYRHRLDEIRNYFKGVKIVFKMGIESFDENFRNQYLRKGIIYDDVEKLSRDFPSVCLLVGIKGQTRDMIRKDIEILLGNFERGCINIFVENSTPVKRDEELIQWFKDEYGHLEELENIEILWNNTDFGVGD